MTLTTQQQQLVEQRLSNEVRSPAIAYLLWFFLGAFGAHRFYLGKVGTAVAMLILFWLGLFTTLILVGWLFLAAYGIWWFVDAFLIPKMIDADRSNRRIQIANVIATSDEQAI